ncbi:MAG TPA: YncE family protein [Streptosporangiaceae bacterium]|nr:YncE family protein [Streptosporangiaceae bacterium]
MTGAPHQIRLTAARQRRAALVSRQHATAARQRRAAVAALVAVVSLAACGSPGHPAATPQRGPARMLPQRILRAPRSLLGLAGPESDGTMWALAGRMDTGLFRFASGSGKLAPGLPVSNTARSVAVSPAGIIALALGSRHSGALELLSSQTLKPVQTVSLPAPARQVATGPGSPAFFVLTAWPSAASVTIVGVTGAIRGTVPLPASAVSVAPDPAQGTLYVLEKTGLVDEIKVSGGKVMASFRAGQAGRAIAISPDGTTLYVLKGTPRLSNIAVMDAATESVRRVLPAPSYCRGLLVSPSGDQLYEVVGTSGYGNIQVFAL